MKEVCTIAFQELSTSSEAIAIIQRDKTNISLCISVKLDGDIEIVISKEDVKHIVDGLMMATID